MARNSVKADTPDPTKYHETKGTISGTMIPRAGADGQSLGFDANKPRVVIVDPGEPGGGFSLDMAAIAKSKNSFNSAAIRVADASAFYKELSNRMQQPETKETVAVEKKGTPVEAIKPLTDLPAIQPLSKLENTQPLPRPAEPEQPREQRNMENNVLYSQVLQQTQTINLLIEKINQLSATTAPSKPADNGTNNPLPVEDTSLTSVLDSFQIPFFKAKPERPQFETYFEMEKLGTIAAKYHAVAVGQDCLALIYDTRFEDGFQYLPPNLGEDRIKISVPKLKGEYTCSSLGLHWSLGCLDVVILIRHTGEV